MTLAATEAFLLAREIRKRAQVYRDLLGEGESLSTLLERVASALDRGEPLLVRTTASDERLLRLILEAREQGWPEDEAEEEQG